MPDTTAARHVGRRRGCGKFLADGSASPTARGSACKPRSTPDFPANTIALPAVDADDESGSSAALWPQPGSAAKTFIDFQNDVTASDVELAHREGYGAVEHIKRYTTLGMGSEQGKTANVAALALAAALSSRSIPETGTTTFRPPYTPGRNRRAGGAASRRALQADAANLLARLGAGTGRGLRRDGAVAAAAVFPQGRRDALARERRP